MLKSVNENQWNNFKTLASIQDESVQHVEYKYFIWFQRECKKIKMCAWLLAKERNELFVLPRKSVNVCCSLLDFALHEYSLLPFNENIMWCSFLLQHVAASPLLFNKQGHPYPPRPWTSLAGPCNSVRGCLLPDLNYFMHLAGPNMLDVTPSFTCWSSSFFVGPTVVCVKVGQVLSVWRLEVMKPTQWSP